MKPPTEGTGTIWVQSDLMPDGTYVTAIHYDDDRSRVLDRQAALRYAAAIHTAATRAEHDAAIFNQLHKEVGVPRDSVAMLLTDLRADRPPIDDEATAPLRLEPGIAIRRGMELAGFVSVFIGDRCVGDWDPADARDHASHVLTVLEAADLDAGYRRALIGMVGIDARRAGQVVNDLAAHINRPTTPGSDGG